MRRHATGLSATSTRPPSGFVSITRTKWLVLAELLQQDPKSRWFEQEGQRIGWHRTGMWYVCPEGYKRVVGRYPDGYWPDAWVSAGAA